MSDGSEPVRLTATDVIRLNEEYVNSEEFKAAEKALAEKVVAPYLDPIIDFILRELSSNKESGE